MQLSAIDLRILAVLQQQASISNVDLADRVGLSPSHSLRRVRILKEAIIIQQRVTLLDPSGMGLNVSVYVSVQPEKQTRERLVAFHQKVTKRPGVVERYVETGESDYLLRVVVHDLHLRTIPEGKRASDPRYGEHPVDFRAAAGLPFDCAAACSP